MGEVVLNRQNIPGEKITLDLLIAFN